MLEPSADGAAVKPPDKSQSAYTGGADESPHDASDEGWAQLLTDALFGKDGVGAKEGGELVNMGWEEGVGFGGGEWEEGEGIGGLGWEVESFSSDDGDDILDSVLFS